MEIWIGESKEGGSFRLAFLGGLSEYLSVRESAKANANTNLPMPILMPMPIY